MVMAVKYSWNTAGDKMARWLGIATATLSKYRSIINRPDA